MKYLIHSMVLTALLGAAPTLAIAAPAAAAQAATADAEITAKVKSQLDANADLKGTDITVTTTTGVVTLTGVVPSVLVRAKVGELVKATPGVSKVNNKLALDKTKK